MIGQSIFKRSFIVPLFLQETGSIYNKSYVFLYAVQLHITIIIQNKLFSFLDTPVARFTGKESETLCIRIF